MNKSAKPYYIAAGVLFAISGLMSKHYLLIICGLALVSLGFTLCNKKDED